MDTLKTASFGTLFAVTFFVAASFQIVMAAVACAFAFVAPGAFKLNDAPAQTPGAALVAVAVMLVVFMLMNLAISAGGSGLWLVVRRFAFKPASPPASVF
jgi:hypothetical protein